MRLAPLLLSVLLSAACAPSAPRAGEIALVESAPIETNLDHPDIPDAHEIWPAMIRAAERSLDTAQFYVSDQEDSRLSPVIAAIESAADRGVAVRLLVDASFARTYPETLDRLEKRRGVSVRRFDVGPVMGGVQHAKYFVVDGKDVYLGSQNFDWRSLTHIQEMGVRLRDPAAAEAFSRVFALDWALAANVERPVFTGAPAKSGLSEVSSGKAVSVTPVFSPKGFLPDPGSWDLPRLIAMIDGAERSVHVQVLTYKTVSRDGSQFPDLDDALRRAAARGVTVELLVSHWAKRKGSLEALKSLSRVPNVTVRFLTVPRWSGGFIAFARVAHAKYMVVDGRRAWVGTSNWEGDYFTRSRNVGVIVEGESFAGRLEKVFRDGFGGPLAEVVNPDKDYQPPKIDDH